MSVVRNEKLAAQVLIVEDEPDHADVMADALRKPGHVYTIVTSGRQALEELRHGSFDVIITDLRMPNSAALEGVKPDGADAGLAVLRAARALQPDAETIMVTAHGDVPTARAAFKEGAYDFIEKPLDLEVFRDLVNRAAETVLLRHESEQLDDLVQHDGFEGIIAGSEPMRRILRTVRTVAASEIPVLITGESGTGKELVANALHGKSPRAGGPLVKINCAALPKDLIESELFGHVKGAFTGAGECRQGLFQAAHGGSLFLDEIGEMSPGLQAKLLRALQEKTVRPVGAEREEPVDVRIIAATHRDLEQEIADGNFRSDLFYRLETFSLRIPSLRERNGDIERLVAALIGKHAEAQGKSIHRVEPAALQALLCYPYPGNVRELENAIMRAVTLAEGGRLSHADLPERIREHGAELRRSTSESRVGALEPTSATQQGWPSLEDVEKRYIRKVLEATGGNKRRTADILGIARRTLYRRGVVHRNAPERSRALREGDHRRHRLRPPGPQRRGVSFRGHQVFSFRRSGLASRGRIGEGIAGSHLPSPNHPRRLGGTRTARPRRFSRRYRYQRWRHTGCRIRRGHADNSQTEMARDLPVRSSGPRVGQPAAG